MLALWGVGGGYLPTHDVLTIELGTVLRLRCDRAALDEEAGARRLLQSEGQHRTEGPIDITAEARCPAKS